MNLMKQRNRGKGIPARWVHTQGHRSETAWHFKEVKSTPAGTDTHGAGFGLGQPQRPRYVRAGVWSGTGWRL